MKHSGIAIVGIAVSIVTASCATDFASGGSTGVSIKKDADLFVQHKPPALRPIFYNLWAEGEHNAVLNLNYLGLAAMENGEFDIAKTAFNEAISRIEAIYANDPNAKKAKSLWSAEKVKDFKGEPYERSMTYYYRGVLYAKDGDYQNARAAFLSAERHDTFSEAEEYQSDFGLMNYLAAWASYCDGDKARASELHARGVDQDSKIASLPFPVRNLILIDAGNGPVKKGKGQHNEVLSFSPALGIQDTVVAVKSKVKRPSDISANFVVGGDVTYQAITRGGRPVQGILNGKADFKDTANVTGDVAVTAGYMTTMQGAYSGDSNMVNAGAYMQLFGLASKVVAGAVTPEADTRTWASLPDKIFIGLPKRQASTIQDFEIEVRSGDETRRATTSFVSRTRACGIAWGRTVSALPRSENGTASITSNPEILEANRADRNKEFRRMLATRFSPGLLTLASESSGPVQESSAQPSSGK